MFLWAHGHSGTFFMRTRPSPVYLEMDGKAGSVTSFLNMNSPFHYCLCVCSLGVHLINFCNCYLASEMRKVFCKCMAVYEWLLLPLQERCLCIASWEWVVRPHWRLLTSCWSATYLLETRCVWWKRRVTSTPTKASWSNWQSTTRNSTRQDTLRTSQDDSPQVEHFKNFENNGPIWALRVVIWKSGCQQCLFCFLLPAWKHLNKHSCFFLFWTFQMKKNIKLY